MFRHALAAAAVLSGFGCTGSSYVERAIVEGPEVQVAVATCEQQYAARALTSLAQVAQCERAIALPQQIQHTPWLSGMYEGLWRDTIALYARVDGGELSKAEADRRIAIERRNWFTNINAMRTGTV